MPSASQEYHGFWVVPLPKSVLYKVVGVINVAINANVAAPMYDIKIGIRCRGLILKNEPSYWGEYCYSKLT